MKKGTIISLTIVLLVGIAGLFYYLSNAPEQNYDLPPIENIQTQIPENNMPDQESVPAQTNGEPVATEEPANEPQDSGKTIIGKSVNGRDITAYHFGAGAKEILFVGGTHGGYSWNTALLAYQLMDYLENNPDDIPANVKITVIPVLNPDGLAKVVDKAGAFSINDVSTSADLAAARFNTKNVDLNRNFDCEWQASGVWQNKTVSGGTAPFSEPESQAIRAYAQNRQLAAVIAWYSAAGGVFSSSCKNGVSTDTQILTDLYANASGYAAHKDFDFYEITGDMTNWFAKINIPAIGVVLATRNDSEWTKNWAACQAVINYFE